MRWWTEAAELARIFRDWERRATSDSRATRRVCRSRAARRSTTQSPTAKITNSSSQSHLDTEQVWRNVGEKNSRNSRSLASVVSLNVSATQLLNICPVATFISNSPDETGAFGRRFADDVKAGDVIALSCGLGSGKTQFVTGLTVGVCAATSSTSPTFTLIHEYFGGRPPLHHFHFFS